jgi:catechol 2,3-dioxygenase-like lactoylglutathione lyase family enzyme
MRSLAHVGVNVPDVEAAVDWYGTVFGMDLILPIGEVTVDDGGHFADLCTVIFGKKLKRFKVAHLATANGAAIELFEFVDPAYEPQKDNFEYWRGGIFHFCVVAPEIEEQVALLEQHGGRSRTGIRTVFEGLPYRASYCEDPWGTIVEVTSHSHERIFSNAS